MVWLIVLVWVLVVMAFIVFVMRLALGESQDRAFSQSLNERVRRAARRRQERENKLPRIAGGHLSFAPGSGEDAPTAEDLAHPYPVYVNSFSVVEVRGTLASDSTDEINLPRPPGVDSASSASPRQKKNAVPSVSAASEPPAPRNSALRSSSPEPSRPQRREPQPITFDVMPSVKSGSQTETSHPSEK
ncbi:hypothetical protein GYM67_08605 [Bifidobacterium asteroides]|uniref:hypothetical protein n=1 Tax=Bifidobacterium asteroides TaxID=1684 RepID=UPI001C6A59CA|nr:hypothetical protein [Bifidobacterium asteroides]QYN61101.1 hypothetical protein GYM67_08605 [Bifidobacterium asteroides]